MENKQEQRHGGGNVVSVFKEQYLIWPEYKCLNGNESDGQGEARSKGALKARKSLDFSLRAMGSH